jgi:hypothetical protein
MVLLKGDGARAVATVPQASVAIPERLIVDVSNDGHSLGEPLVFEIKKGDIEPGPLLQKASEAQPGMLTRSKAMEYGGLSPKDNVIRAVELARKENPRATLREIQGYRWETYGDPALKEPSKIVISEWLYLFAATDGEAIPVVVSKDAVSIAKEIPNATAHARKLAPLSEWSLDVADAIQIAARNGLKVETGPALRMFKLRGSGQLLPMWKMPGAPSILIDGLNHRVVDPDDVEG